MFGFNQYSEKKNDQCRKRVEEVKGILSHYGIPEYDKIRITEIIEEAYLAPEDGGADHLNGIEEGGGGF